MTIIRVPDSSGNITLPVDLMNAAGIQRGDTVYLDSYTDPQTGTPSILLRSAPTNCSACNSPLSETAYLNYTRNDHEIRLCPHCIAHIIHAMGSDHYHQVQTFTYHTGQYAEESPKIPDEPVIALRKSLIQEEYNELKDAIDQKSLCKIADALADLLYVVYGTAIAFGIDIRPIFRRVHLANMQKTPDNTRPDGKLLKPKDWQSPEPDIQQLLNDQINNNDQKDDSLG